MTILLETSDSVIVLSTCVSPQLTTIARIFHLISFGGLVGLLIIVPFRQQIINSIEGGTERKYRLVLRLNIAERVLGISISLTLALWFVSPFLFQNHFPVASPSFRDLFTTY